MTLRVVGAGLGRTGTHSLKLALERLLGAPCYHMVEVFARPEHVPMWHSAAQDVMPDWQELFKGYAAAVDWPACSFWPELHAEFPEAIVLLSVRDADSWWQSASETIFPASLNAEPGEWRSMFEAICMSRFVLDLTDEAAAKAAFERHYESVRRSVAPSRLIEWRAGDGWGRFAEPWV